VIARDTYDNIIVQEKLDGSNVSVAKVDGQILALGRAGYLAQTSKYEMHQRFAAWVRTRERQFDHLLREGERVCGEWLLQAHGTIYEPIAPRDLFRPFDIMRKMDRVLSEEVYDRCLDAELLPVTTIYKGGPHSIGCALSNLDNNPYTLKPIDGSSPEGCVWRVERKGKVDFLAKYVRPEKVDGKYLDGPPIWMTR
jgi:hypothetical protein